MKLRGKILLAFAAAFLLAGLWFLFDHHGEPRYGGHPVSYWFREYCYSTTHQPYHDDDEEQAEKALTTIGTNAVPYLLTLALDTNADTPAWKAVQSFFNENFPDSQHRPRFVSQIESRDEAIALIRKIDPPAALVLPGVRANLSQTNAMGYWQGIAVFSAIASPTNDPDALAHIFAQALHSPDQDARNKAITGINRLNLNGIAAIPDLISVLQTTPATDSIRDEFAGMLGNFGTNARAALPELQTLFHEETNTGDRTMFAATIARIDPEDTEAFGYLTNSLTNHASEVQVSMAIWRLKYAGPRATNAISALLNDLSATNEVRWGLVMNTLKSIGATNGIVIDRVRESLRSTNDDIREEAARFLLHVDKNDQDAQGVLVDLITNQSESEGQAIFDLGEAGPAAKATIPVILSVLDGTNDECWPAVPDALTNMGAPVSLFLNRLEEKSRPEYSGELGIKSKIEFLAGTVLTLDPGNREAQLSLLRFKDRLAFEMLGRANPAIDEVKTRLRQLSKDDDHDIVRLIASGTLKRIEANEKKK